MSTAIDESSRNGSQLREQYGNLLDMIINTTDHRRWDAIEQLNNYGYTNYEISEACDKHHKFVDKWRSRNRDKYENRPAKRQTQVVKSEDYSNGLPRYGEIPPTNYVSKLNDIDWGIKYLGYSWRKQYQQGMADEIKRRMTVLVKLGRDHGKTWIMLELFIRFILEEAPKRVIVIASQAKYREMYEFVDTMLETEAIRKDYGDVKASSSIQNGIWFVEGLRPRVGPNFLIKGSESFITGLHFEGIDDSDYFDDPEDIINIDDIDEIGWLHLEDIVQELKVAEAAEKRVRRWLKRTVNYIRNHRVKLTANATSKDPDDIYSMMEKEFQWPVYVIKALEIESGRLPNATEVEADHERGLLLDWPREVGVYRTLECPNWPLPRLLYYFVFHRSDAEAELNNNPIPSDGAEFDADDWDAALIDPYEDDDFYSFTFIDPGYGQGGSKTAILQIGVYFNFLVLIDAFVGHLGPTEYINKILEFKNKHNSMEIWLEDNFRQESRSLSAYNPLTHLSELRTFTTPPGKSKRLRIGLVGGQFASRIWKVYRTVPFLSEIEQEYLIFSSKLSDSEIRKKFNALDTMAMAYEKKKNKLGKKRYNNAVKQKVMSVRSNARSMF